MHEATTEMTATETLIDILTEVLGEDHVVTIPNSDPQVVHVWIGEKRLLVRVEPITLEVVPPLGPVPNEFSNVAYVSHHRHPSRP